MKPEQLALIEQAISALKLRDIMLHGCSFRRPTPPPADSDSIDARQQSKRQVKFVIGTAPAGDAGQSLTLLQVYVELGMRVSGTETEARPVYFEIEADFLVEYEIKSELSPDAMKAFADINSVHNVWPFWRQHVFDVVSRGRLPHLEIPLFSGAPTKATRNSQDARSVADSAV